MRRIYVAVFVALAGTAVACGDGSSEANPPPTENRERSCLIPRADEVQLASFLSRQVAALCGDAPLPGGTTLTDRASAANRQATRAYLLAELQALGLTAEEEAYGGGANVVARLPPTKDVDATTEWIVVGAHFDTVPTTVGANDNATGVAAVLAVAQTLRDLPCRSRGAMFVFFDQEEIGLLGSKAFAKRLAEAATAVVAVHTVDQVGWDADDDRTFEIERPTTTLFAEYQAAAQAVGARVVETKTSGTDHQALRAAGFAAAGVTEEYATGDTSPHNHAPGDRPPTVKASYHALAVQLVTHVVARELGAE